MQDVEQVDPGPFELPASHYSLGVFTAPSPQEGQFDEDWKEKESVLQSE